MATILRPGDELMEIIEMFMEDGKRRTASEVYDLLTDNGIVVNDVDPKGAVGLELALSNLIVGAPGGSPSDDYVYTHRQLVRS